MVKVFLLQKPMMSLRRRIEKNKPYTIQEFVMGTSYYLHYFYSPIQDNAYKLSKGSLTVAFYGSS